MAAKPKKQPAVGVIRLIENPDGSLNPQFEVDSPPGTDENVTAHLHAAVNGLLFLYSQDSDKIDMLGQAFLIGLDRGVNIGKKFGPMKDKKHPVGFHDFEAKDAK